MTDDQREELLMLCIKYRSAKAGESGTPYIWIQDYVETLIDEAAKDAIKEYIGDKDRLRDDGSW